MIRLPLTFTTLCLLTACVPNFSLPHSAADTDLWESSLQVEYQLAFEKRLYVNLEDMHALETKTREALQDTSIASRNLVKAQQHHHKLKSYLSYLYAAEVLDDLGVIKKNLAALVLDKLRQTPAELIDASSTSDEFFQQVMTKQFNTTEISRNAKQEFFQALLASIATMTEDTLRQQYHLFPFMADDFNAICEKHALDDCMRFAADTSTQQALPPFAGLAEVTEHVNDIVTDLNIAIKELSRLPTKASHIFQHTDFKNNSVITIYQYYELVLMDATRRGVLPIMFAPTFRQRSGNIWLKQSGVNAVNNRLLTTVSAVTVATALQETQQNLLDSLAQINKMQQAQSPPRDKKIYQWVVNNEVAAARVIAQDPAHALVVVHVLHKYQDKARNPLLVMVDTVITHVELSCMLLIVPALAVNVIPSLAVFNIPRTIAFVGTMMNFPWVGVTQTKHLIARNRYLMLERALLRGSSARVTYSLKLLHEMQRLRRYAIISGTIGMALSVPAVNYIISHTDAGFRNNLVDIVSSIFADYENVVLFIEGKSNNIDASESELETKPGHSVLSP